MIQSAPCSVCQSYKIPGTGKQPWEMGALVRTWSDIDDYAPVHLVCERRHYPSAPGSPRRRWRDRLLDAHLTRQRAGWFSALREWLRA